MSDVKRMIEDALEKLDAMSASELQKMFDAAGVCESSDNPIQLKDNILPCPFCGSSNVKHVVRVDYEFIMCNGCGAMVDAENTRPERKPIEVWNMRSIPNQSLSTQK